MKILIIEDEVLAAQTLQKLLCELKPEAEIIDVLETVEESIEWFENNEMPDLLFLDIHLADGSSFAIFEKIDITCPIIFTTAYDEYALKAFEVNSIDYLLKPINKKDLRHAMEKYRTLVVGRTQMQKFMMQMEPQQRRYRSCFLMPERDKLLPLPVSDIAYIYIDFKMAKIVTFDRKEFLINTTLDDLMELLDPDHFFRANRQYIVSRRAIKDITIWFGSKLVVNLIVEVPEKIVISKAKVSDFKNWFLN